MRDVVLPWRCTLYVLALGLAAACGDMSASTESAATIDGDSAAGTVPEGAQESGARPASAEPAADSALLSLEGEGLRAFLSSTGAARPLPFGTPAADALSFVSAVLGAAPVEQGENVDCAAAYARWANGLTVWFARGELAGWSVGQGSPLTTVDGLGLGATRAELEAAYDPVIARSSLGEEFTAGGVAGLLESAASDARVQHLWAGHACIAR